MGEETYVNIKVYEPVDPGVLDDLSVDYEAMSSVCNDVTTVNVVNTRITQVVYQLRINGYEPYVQSY